MLGGLGGGGGVGGFIRFIGTKGAVLSSGSLLAACCGGI